MALWILSRTTWVKRYQKGKTRKVQPIYRFTQVPTDIATVCQVLPWYSRGFQAEVLVSKVHALLLPPNIYNPAMFTLKLVHSANNKNQFTAVLLATGLTSGTTFAKKSTKTHYRQQCHQHFLRAVYRPLVCICHSQSVFTHSKAMEGKPKISPFWQQIV